MFSVALILLLTAGSCVFCIDLIQPDSKVVQPGLSMTITCRPSGYSLTDGCCATGVFSSDLIQPDSKVVQPGESLTITCRPSGYSLTAAYATGVYCIDLIQPDSKLVQPGQSLIITCQPSGYSTGDDNYATGAWSEIKLEQSASEVKGPGETVKMSCIISGYSMTEYYIHWIRQRPGRALEWIGWPPSMEAPFKLSSNDCESSHKSAAV
ncbi:hypothetical protein CRENBAI_006554 [Crenichthys baileyi]|uniref:Ig-like domain-containing protein n=1 Tax=Crenichthys baileyi TaxID=28760 RepID=A0AAV9RMZ5_9TELE